VFEAANGCEALDLFEQELPELILTDLRMPEMDGLTLIREMHKKHPDTPLIVISGTGSISSAMEAVHCGAWDFIEKPIIDQSALEMVISHTLERSRLLLENRRYHDHLEELVQERTVELHQQTLLLEQEMAERQEAQQRLAIEHAELQRLNATLEQRVQEEVEKNRDQERIISHQARLAAMGEMLSNIAHQWRQPLNNLGLYLQNMQLDYQESLLDTERMAEYVSCSMETLQYMSRTISDFQNFFRPDREKKKFTIALAIQEAVHLVEASLKTKGITIRVETSGECAVLGFSNEFSQVVLNIINNARDVLLDRQVPDPVIRIACRCEGKTGIVTIGDNAGGIPEELLDKVFDPYFTTKAKSQGTGLGLYMAKMILSKGMGGHLMAHNAGNGAEFVMEIPIAS